MLLLLVVVDIVVEPKIAGYAEAGYFALDSRLGCKLSEHFFVFVDSDKEAVECVESDCFRLNLKKGYILAVEIVVATVMGIATVELFVVVVVGAIAAAVFVADLRLQHQWFCLACFDYLVENELRKAFEVRLIVLGHCQRAEILRKKLVKL